MGKDISDRLVQFALETKYENIPPEVIDYTKRLALKTVCGMIAGSAKASGRKMAGIIRDQRLPEEVGVMGSGFKTALWQAVLLHGYFAHASELEDDRFTQTKNGGIAWDITVIPLLFPLAEKLSLSGKALLESLAVGLETATRTCLWGAKHLGLGQIPGAVGSAFAASKALGLDARQTAGAMGLALSSAPLAVVNYGTDGHYLESALMSLQGMMAAQMAGAGLAGNPDIVTFLTNFLGKDVVEGPERIVEDLGKKWLLCELWIKKYPCCFRQHQQIDLILEMKKKHRLSLDDIETIEVHGGLSEKTCDRPEPMDEQQLQFSFQHVLSAAMLDGDVNLRNISPEAVSDPRMKEARKKVKFIYHADWPATDSNRVPGRVGINDRLEEIRTGKGHSHRSSSGALDHAAIPRTLCKIHRRNIIR